MNTDLLSLVHFEDSIKDLKKDIASEKLPIYIYGAGSYAKSVIKLIQSVDQEIKACVVDDIFLREENVFGEIAVISVSIFLQRINTDICLVMGMTNFGAGKELQLECPFIKRIYYPTSLSFEKDKEFSKEYLQDNLQKFEEVYELLADKKSKECFVAWIDSAIHNDTTRMFHVCDGVSTYFDNSLFTVKPETTLIDVGAYTGDTIEEFLNATNKIFTKIWAVEGDAELCRQIQNFASNKGILKKIEILNSCVWSDEKDILVNYLETEINSVGMTASESDTNGECIHVVPLDSLIKNKEGLSVDMIKMAMRGAEKIVEGARHIIQENHPILAAKVGFDRMLFYNMIQTILGLDSTYKIFLRFNNLKLEELVLYAM